VVTFDLDIVRREVLKATAIRMLRRWPARIVAAGAVVVGTIGVVLLLSRGDDGGFLFVTALVIGYLGFIIWLAGLRAWRTTPLRQRGTVELDAEGVRYRNAKLESRVSWELYPEAIETPAMFVLFTPQGHFPLPKRCFRSQDDLLATRELIEAHSNMSRHTFW
jgi:multisubunit Na+/H+ antiporter MnhF subunit